MLAFKNMNNSTVTVVCDNGEVIIDRKLYEQKLGTLVSCKTKEEVFQLAKDSKSFLEKHYKTSILPPSYSK